ncbi:hypothetical protein [Henriciella algicola]|uniref:Uncharacterized protein n=1 Tax=Henriciella algicola TaxID=1608422 RepID=A0A399RDH5_9PROT|nr:hypothetical protein [Henriciella algicola]RIJ29636.1 hypothetical protein D1222_09625 [Henriciella algicola]
MSDTPQFELNRRLFSGAQQFGYFLMAVAGACIAAAISHTTSNGWSNLHWVWLAAVSFWGFSFFFGIRATEQRLILTGKNAAYFALQDALEGGEVQTPYPSALLSVAKQRLKENPNGSGPFVLQKWSIFLGGLSYLAFHILQMRVTEAQ